MNLERRIAMLEDKAGLGKSEPSVTVICVRWYGTEKKDCLGYDDTERCIRYKESEKPNGRSYQVFFQACEGCEGVVKSEAGA